MQENLRLTAGQLPFRHRRRLRVAALPPLRRLRRRPPPPHHTQRNLHHNLHQLRRRRHLGGAAVHVQLHFHAAFSDHLRARLGQPVPARPVHFHPLGLLISKLHLRPFFHLPLRLLLLLPGGGGARPAAVPADEHLLRLLSGES